MMAGDDKTCSHGVLMSAPCGLCVVEKRWGPDKSLSRRVGALEAWWLEMANEEIERTVPKAIEYGATDLAEIGRQIRLAGDFGPCSDTPDDELGVYFYMVGKMARWTDAIRTGRRVSDDTLFDIGIYVRMVQRIRHSGSWPGLNTEGDQT